MEVVTSARVYFGASFNSGHGFSQSASSRRECRDHLRIHRDQCRTSDWLLIAKRNQIFAINNYQASPLDPNGGGVIHRFIDRTLAGNDHHVHLTEMILLPRSTAESSSASTGARSRQNPYTSTILSETISASTLTSRMDSRPPASPASVLPSTTSATSSSSTVKVATSSSAPPATSSPTFPRRPVTPSASMPIRQMLFTSV